MTLNVTIDYLRKSNVASASAYDSVFLDCEESGLNKNNIMWRVSQRRICICSALIVCAPSLRATNHMMPARRHASCDIKVPNTKDTFFFIKFTYQIYLFIGPFRGGCTAKVQTWPAENSGCHDKLESGKAKCLWKSCQREVRAQLPNSQKDASWWQEPTVSFYSFYTSVERQLNDIMHRTRQVNRCKMKRYTAILQIRKPLILPQLTLNKNRACILLLQCAISDNMSALFTGCAHVQVLSIFTQTSICLYLTLISAQRWNDDFCFFHTER